LREERVEGGGSLERWELREVEVEGVGN